MKKNNKKILTVLVCLAIVMITFAGFYISKRNKANQYLNETMERIDECKYQIIWNDEFFKKIKEIKNEYKLRTNKQINNLADELNNELDNKTCIKEEFIQLGSNEIDEEVNNLIGSSKDYGVGKLFIYTEYNFGKKLEKPMDYVDCTIYAYNLSDKMIIDNESKIKVRGNSTSTLAKKPYNIKFSEKVDLYGFGESKKWSLLADAMDPTMLRNRVSLDFAREMELEYTSNCEYVELWLDGEYLGNYLLTESVETGKNRVDIDVDNGDFLFEYESSRVEEDVSYVSTKHGWRFAMSDPEEPDEETYKYLNNKIQELEDAVYSNNYEDVCKIVDIDSFAKLYILNEFNKTVDFGFSSVNFYYKGNKFYAGPAWDFDLSAGNAQIGNYIDYWFRVDNNNKTVFNSYEDLWCSNNLIYKQLLQYPEFKAKVKETFSKYSNYIENIYNEGGIIDTLLDNYGELINNNYSSIDSNGAGWNYIYAINLKPFNTYEENVQYLKSWQKDRYEYLKGIFEKY